MYKLKYLRESELLTQKQSSVDNVHTLIMKPASVISPPRPWYALQTSTTSQLTIFWAEQKIRR